MFNERIPIRYGNKVDKSREFTGVPGENEPTPEEIEAFKAAIAEEAKEETKRNRKEAISRAEVRETQQRSEAKSGKTQEKQESRAIEGHVNKGPAQAHHHEANRSVGEVFDGEGTGGEKEPATEGESCWQPQPLVSHGDNPSPESSPEGKVDGTPSAPAGVGAPGGQVLAVSHEGGEHHGTGFSGGGKQEEVTGGEGPVIESDAPAPEAPTPEETFIPGGETPVARFTAYYQGDGGSGQKPRDPCYHDPGREGGFPQGQPQQPVPDGESGAIPFSADFPGPRGPVAFTAEAGPVSVPGEPVPGAPVPEGAPLPFGQPPEFSTPARVTSPFPFPGEEGITVEAKSFAFSGDTGPSGPDQVPPGYVPQGGYAPAPREGLVIPDESSPGYAVEGRSAPGSYRGGYYPEVGSDQGHPSPDGIPQKAAPHEGFGSFQPEVEGEPVVTFSVKSPAGPRPGLPAPEAPAPGAPKGERPVPTEDPALVDNRGTADAETPENRRPERKPAEREVEDRRDHRIPGGEESRDSFHPVRSHAERREEPAARDAEGPDIPEASRSFGADAGNDHGDRKPWERDENEYRIDIPDKVRLAEVEDGKKEVVPDAVRAEATFQRLNAEQVPAQAPLFVNPPVRGGTPFTQEVISLVDRVLVTADPAARTQEVRMVFNETVLPDTEIRFAEVSGTFVVTLVSESDYSAELLRKEAPDLAEVLRSKLDGEVEVRIVTGVGAGAREETVA